MKRISLATCCFALLSLIALDVCARAGGGFGGGGFGGGRMGGGFSGGTHGGETGLFRWYWPLYIFGRPIFIPWLVVIIGSLFALMTLRMGYCNYEDFRLKRKHKKISAALTGMAQTDPEWAEPVLLELVREKFILLQTAWSEQNLEVIKQHLHPELFSVWEAHIKNQILREEKNIIDDLRISAIRIIDARNYRDNSRDEFTVAFDASALDAKVWRKRVIKTSTAKFREFWTFQKLHGAWILKAVTQAHKGAKFVSSPIIFE